MCRGLHLVGGRPLTVGDNLLSQDFAKHADTNKDMNTSQEALDFCERDTFRSLQSILPDAPNFETLKVFLNPSTTRFVFTEAPTLTV